MTTSPVQPHRIPPEVTQEGDGWSRVPHWLLKAVPPTAVVVYAQLAAYAWMPDGARPAVQRLAEDLNVSRVTVKRALADLVNAGAVVVQQRWADPEQRQQMPSRYHLRLQPVDPASRVERSSQRTAPMFTDEPPRLTGEPTPRLTGEPTPGSPVSHEEEEVKEEEVEEEEGGGLSPARIDETITLPDSPPLPRCAAHHGTVFDGPCGPCGDARRAFDAWRLTHPDPTAGPSWANTATPEGVSPSTYVPTLMCPEHPAERAGYCGRCAHVGVKAPNLRALRDTLTPGANRHT